MLRNILFNPFFIFNIKKKIMQKRSKSGVKFEYELEIDNFKRVSRSPKVKYSGKGRTIFEKMKNSGYNPELFYVTDDSNFEKYDLVNTVTGECYEVKKYKKSKLNNWILYSEPFFKVSNRDQVSKVDVNDYNDFVLRFWEHNNKTNFFNDIITKITKGISGMYIIDDFIPIEQLDFRFVIVDGWMGYKRITLQFKLKN